MSHRSSATLPVAPTLVATLVATRGAARTAPPARVLARRALRVAAWALAAALLAQVFTAGMAVFVHPGWWARHRAFVHAFEWLAPLALMLALVGRAPRAVVALAAGAVALLAAQYTTAHLRLAAGGPGWAAVHPVSAVLLFWTATELARRAARLVVPCTGVTGPAPTGGPAHAATAVAPEGA